MEKEISVVDSLMGTGKTAYMIWYINNAPSDARFFIITPYIKETERIACSCPTREIYLPQEKNSYPKSADLYIAIKEKRNIACTHSLFRTFELTAALMKVIQEAGYTLFIDETLNMIEPLDLRIADVELLQTGDMIQPDSQSTVQWRDKKYSGRFKDIKESIMKGEVVFYENVLLYLFPLEKLTVFRHVELLTYRFDYSNMFFYLKSKGFRFIYYHIWNGVRIEGRNDFSWERLLIKPKINIYSGKLNDTIEGMKLSKSGYKAAQRKKDSRQISCILGNTYNYFYNKCHANVNNAMWTIYDDIAKRRKVRSYAGAFVPCNERASNKYRDRYYLAYLIDFHIHPTIYNWFYDSGEKIDTDEYALNFLLQWIWRSAIRDNKEINIYIPSERMRNLLINWLQ